MGRAQIVAQLVDWGFFSNLINYKLSLTLMFPTMQGRITLLKMESQHEPDGPMVLYSLLHCEQLVIHCFRFPNLSEEVLLCVCF